MLLDLTVEIPQEKPSQSPAFDSSSKIENGHKRQIIGLQDGIYRCCRATDLFHQQSQDFHSYGKWRNRLRLDMVDLPFKRHVTSVVAGEKL